MNHIVIGQITQWSSKNGVTNNGTCRKQLVISLCVEYIVCIEVRETK